MVARDSVLRDVRGQFIPTIRDRANRYDRSIGEPAGWATVASFAKIFYLAADRGSYCSASYPTNRHSLNNSGNTTTYSANARSN